MNDANELNQPVIEAVAIADTRESERQLGFRNVGARERRMLFQAEDCYVELQIPSEPEEGGWLYGQLILPTPEAQSRFQEPIFAMLRDPHGATGATRATGTGDFALPFNESGAFELQVVPRMGPRVRLRFEH